MNDYKPLIPVERLRAASAALGVPVSEDHDVPAAELLGALLAIVEFAVQIEGEDRTRLAEIHTGYSDLLMSLENEDPERMEWRWARLVADRLNRTMIDFYDDVAAETPMLQVIGPMLKSATGLMSLVNPRDGDLTEEGFAATLSAARDNLETAQERFSATFLRPR